MPFIYAEQAPANPDAIFSVQTFDDKPEYRWLPTKQDPPDWSSVVDKETDTHKTRVRVATVTYNNGNIQDVVMHDDGTLIAPIGPVQAGGDKARAAQWAREESIRNQAGARAERKITNVSVIQDDRPGAPPGKYVKKTDYEDGVPKYEDVDPKTSVTTLEINGKRYLVETTEGVAGVKPTIKYTDLTTGQEVNTLPVDQSQANQGPKPRTEITKGGDGKQYAITINPDGTLAGPPKALDIPAEVRGTTISVDLPNGGKQLVFVDQNGNAKPVYQTPGTPSPPASSGNFVPDPRKPAMGLGEYTQQLAQLRATGKITDAQMKDLKEAAYQIALAEAKRLDTIVQTQRGVTQDAITQRANDLQAQQGRLNYTGQATQNAYDTAIKIAQSVNPKAFKASGGDTNNILASIMGVQDTRAAAAGGFFQPPTVTPAPGSALAEINQWGVGAGVTPGAPGTTPPAAPLPGGTPVFAPNQPYLGPVTSTPSGGEPPARAGGSPQTPAPAPTVAPTPGAVTPDSGQPAPTNPTPVNQTPVPITPPSNNDPNSVGTPPVLTPPQPDEPLPDGATPLPSYTTPPYQAPGSVTPDSGQSAPIEDVVLVEAGNSPMGTRYYTLPRSQYEAQSPEWQAAHPVVRTGTEGQPNVGPTYEPESTVIVSDSTSPIGTRYYQIPRSEYEKQDAGWKASHPIVREGTTSPGTQSDARSVSPSWLQNPSESALTSAPASSWFTPGNPDREYMNNEASTAAYNQAWMADAAHTTASNQRIAAMPQMGASPMPSGGWFTPGVPPSNISPVPPIQPVANSLHPVVGSLMQKYSNDPEMQQALMTAQGMF